MPGLPKAQGVFWSSRSFFPVPTFLIAPEVVANRRRLSCEWVAPALAGPPLDERGGPGQRGGRAIWQVAVFCQHGPVPRQFSSLGSKTTSATTGHLQWSVTFATGTLQAKATKGGSVVATDTVETAGAASKLALTPDRPSMTADGRDLSYVEVDIEDAQGVVVPKAGSTINVAISGPGTLVGLDAGDSTNHDPYKGTSHAAFNGKLMAIVQSTGTPGTVTVSATSGSLTAGSATITTQAP
jgi:hypothetical protein